MQDASLLKVCEMIQMREMALRDYESGLETALEKGHEKVARRLLARGVARNLIFECDRIVRRRVGEIRVTRVRL